MNWRKVKDKYVIHKRGVYLALEESEVLDLLLVANDILSGEGNLEINDNR
jgi:hypothetical protein